MAMLAIKRKILPSMLAPIPLTWPERIANYDKELPFPQSLFIAGDGRCVGYWFGGQSYRVSSGYHGGYPHGYLRRIKALFPDKKRVLHLFSGAVDLSILPGDTCDINPERKPTYVDDAQTLAKVPLERYDLILADPPYTDEDSGKYGTTPIKRNRVMGALGRCRPGTHVVWLDMAWPMFSKEVWSIEAAIGLAISTNHRFRTVMIYRRV